MGDELQELATKKDSSEFADKEQEAGPEVSQEETALAWTPLEIPQAPHTVTSLIPLFGILPKALAMSFGTFDDVSVRDSVSFVVPR